MDNETSILARLILTIILTFCVAAAILGAHIVADSLSGIVGVNEVIMTTQP